MRAIAWAGALICSLAAGPAVADPVHYTIDFTLGPNANTLPTAAGFYYDPVASVFTDFHIVWAGIDLDFTAAANSPLVDPTDPVCNVSNAASTFAMLSGACSANGKFWHGGGGRFLMEDISDGRPHIEVNYSEPTGSAVGRGGWTITASPVPEPGALPTLLLGMTVLAAAGRVLRRL